MLRRMRLGFAVVAPLAVAALLGAPAAPAAAAVPQAAITMSSTSAVPGAPAQDVVITVTNKGPGVMKNVMLVVDWESYQYEEISFSAKRSVTDCEAGAVRTTECHLTKSTLQAGESAQFHATLYAAPDAPIGPAGSLAVWPKFDGYDPPQPKAFEFPLTVGVPADLLVHAWDVPAVISGDEVTIGQLTPGGTGALLVAFANRGDKPAGILSFTVTLPRNEHITFDNDLIRADPRFEGCTTGWPRVTCSFKDLVLQPASAGLEKSTWGFALPVKADKGAKGPKITGGVAEVAGVELTPEQAEAKLKARSATPRGLLTASAELPTGAVGRAGSDDFAIFIKAAGASPSPSASSGTGSGNGDGDGGEDDPTLPITGPVASGVAATGVAVVLVGLVLFLAARRRRVVVVAPGDES